MPTFQPAFSFWPRPEFLGNSKDGFSAWIGHRNVRAAQTPELLRSDTVRQIIEAHHDRNARTIPSR